MKNKCNQHAFLFITAETHLFMMHLHHKMLEHSQIRILDHSAPLGLCNGLVSVFVRVHICVAATTARQSHVHMWRVT